MRYKKVIRRVNGNSVEAFEPEKISTGTKIIIGLLIISFEIILVMASIVYGVGKERMNKNCIGVTQMQAYENTLSIAETICVDIQKRQMDDIENYYRINLKTAEEEAKRWKNIYNLKLKETATTSTTTEIIKN